MGQGSRIKDHLVVWKRFRSENRNPFSAYSNALSKKKEKEKKVVYFEDSEVRKKEKLNEYRRAQVKEGSPIPT